MWLDLLLVSLIGGIAATDTTAAWQVMLCRPIVSGPLVGLAMGHLQAGLLFGALMELVWAREVPIGAAVFPDSNVGTVVGTAVAVYLQRLGISSSISYLVSFLYMIPVAFIGGRSIVLMRRWNRSLKKRALACAEKGNVRGVVGQNQLGLVNAFGRGFLFSGLMCIPGAALCPMICSLCGEMEAGVQDMGLIPVLALGGAVMLSIFGRKRTAAFLGLGLVVGCVISFF